MKRHAGHLGEFSYRQVLGWNIATKWPTQEEKDEWYGKHNVANRKKLEKLFAAQSGKCIFCHCDTWMGPAGVDKPQPPAGFTLKRRATIDHIKPQFHGGTYKLTNLAMACSDCNSRRGTKDFGEFKDARSDPEKWKAHTRKLGREMNDRARERQSKSLVRREAFIMKLAWSIYIIDTYGPKTG